jgi:rare lipoprotein A
MPRLPFFPIRRWGACCLVGLSLLLVACGSAPRKEEQQADRPQTSAPVSKPGYYMDDGPGANPPGNLADIPDAVPRPEPLHKGANRPYTVFGKTYVPNVSNEPFKQTGIASWYGRKFHGLKTSIGETYDMYAMTAAHPTLPLPCYVRVTNVATGKSVVVRVNDRGPFLHDRVIDLSYAAASRIGIAGPGSGKVTVERLFPGDLVAALPSRATPQASAPIATPVPVQPPIQVQPLVPPTPISANATGVFIQLGAFGSLENAEGFRDKMVRDLSWMREPITVAFKDGLQRVRIGPLANREEAEAIADKVRETHNLPLIISKP